MSGPQLPLPEQQPPPSGRSGTGVSTRVVVALLCALLGLGLVVQVRRTASGDALATARPDDLVQLLDGLQRREADLTGEIAGLQDTLVRLRSSGASSAEALAEAQRQAAVLGILTGAAPATGPGVRIVIDDPQARVPPEVLLDALQELRNAGAEAVQVNDVRIGVNSSFSGRSGAITVDGTAVSAPYTIRAIGDPPTLTAAMNIPGGVGDTAKRAGGTLVITAEQTVTVDALRPLQPTTYARPAGG